MSSLKSAFGLPVTDDSRKVEKDGVFVAIRGSQSDGHDYVDKANESGAQWIVVDRKYEGLGENLIVVDDTREALAELACEFYKNPSHQMKMIAVTGTSGKTTTTFLIESILKSAGMKVGLIGTIEFRLDGVVKEATHTTPGPMPLNALLREMADQGCEAVVMEVSSHGLEQKRTAGLAFDVMVFTNLSRDHLDYHTSMEEYFDSKKLLFEKYPEYSERAGKSPALLTNAEDGWGKKLLGIEGVHGVHAPSAFKADLNGIRGESGGVRFHSALMGAFNGMNVAQAIEAGQVLSISPEKIDRGITSLHSVPGRMERVGKKGPYVFVDYAHKPEALAAVLKTLRNLCEGKLITVFGCGGDRDRGKRPIMGEIAAKGSDLVWVTSDNPRTEDPQGIIDEIITGIPKGSSHKVEVDRKKAIERAIAEASDKDVVLIAGKGHEDYQIVGKTKLPMDDREIARAALSN